MDPTIYLLVEAPPPPLLIIDGAPPEPIVLSVGLQGAPGSSGVGIVDAGINDAGDLLLALSNGNTVDAGHVVGPPGPPAPVFSWQQALPAASWNIVHNLHGFPAVRLLDTAGNLLLGVVTYPSPDQVSVFFSVPLAGTAYLS